ncbi:FG-GAP-like repeat-containing protein [Georgenia wangjunii]|uniref:FG-GAP-like repeat-containing protein n=1 Tax=Georgenia wangjunii TaxID=3117730 RepID=UPI002F26A29E
MALGLVATFLVAVPTSAQAAPAQADTIVSLVNQARAQHGLRPMRVNGSLTSIAQDWSQRQAAANTMSHRPNFTSGYPAGWTRGAENVAWHSQNNPQAVFNGWMNSAGHRANILNPSLTDIGVGWAMASSGRYYATQNFAAYAGSTAPAPAPAPTGTPGNKDYNGDGRADVLTISSTGRLALYPGNGRNGWGTPRTIGTGWTGYELIAPGDFNGDGRADILAIAPNGLLYLYAGTGSGFAGKVQIGNGWGGFTNVFSPGDFNGDGRADILATTAAGDMHVYYGSGTGRISGSAKIGFGWAGYTDIFDGGDFNADGRGDIFARDSSGRLYAYYSRAGNTMSARTQIGSGWAGFDHISAVGDFSGDGRSDILGVDGRSGNAYIYPSTGRGTFGARVQVGNGWGIFDTVR